jgi:hypothetical protein
MSFMKSMAEILFLAAILALLTAGWPLYLSCSYFFGHGISREHLSASLQKLLGSEQIKSTRLPMITPNYYSTSFGPIFGYNYFLHLLRAQRGVYWHCQSCQALETQFFSECRINRMISEFAGRYLPYLSVKIILGTICAHQHSILALISDQGQLRFDGIFNNLRIDIMCSSATLFHDQLNWETRMELCSNST